MGMDSVASRLNTDIANEATQNDNMRCKLAGVFLAG